MLIDSMIRFSNKEWFKLPEGVRNHIKKSLSYKNPKYYATERMGFSTKGIPKSVNTISQDPNTGDISISRGEARLVINAITDYPVPIDVLVGDNSSIADLPDIVYENKEFELDERQKRCIDACMACNQGIIKAATSSGKSEMILKLIAEKKQKALVVVNRKVLLQQLVKDAKKRLKGCSIGTIVGGKADFGDVTFALERSLLKHLAQAKRYFGMVIADEVHIAAAPSFQKIYNQIDAKNRFGFTGTVKRKDGMHFLMYAAFGSIIAEVTSDEIIEAGRAVSVQTIVHDTQTSLPPEIFDIEDPIRFNREADSLIHKSAVRDTQIIGLIHAIMKENENAKIAVACRYLDPLHRLNELLTEDLVPTGMVIGEEKDQEGICKRMEDGELKVILSTIPCFSTGINIKSLTDLILISPVFSNELLIHQLRGRLMRVDGVKTCGKMHFMWDENVYDEKKLRQFLAIMRKS